MYIMNYLLYIVGRISFVSVLFSFFFSAGALASQWTSFSYSDTGFAQSSCSSLTEVTLHACFWSAEGVYSKSYGDPIVLTHTSGQQYNAQWVGISGSMRGGWLHQRGRNNNGWDGRCNSVTCAPGLIIGYPSGSSVIINPNRGCSMPGIQCNQKYFYTDIASTGSCTLVAGSVNNNELCDISVNVGSPTWVLVVDGPAGTYSYPGGSSVPSSILFPVGTEIPVFWATMGGKQAGGTPTVALAAKNNTGDTVIADVELVLTTCEFDMPDIDFGQISVGTAQEERQEYFSSVCSSTASVTLKITDTSGRTGPYTFAGGALSVIFPGSGSSSYTFSVPGGVTDTTRVNAVLSGEVVSGTYNFPMVVTAQYN